MQAAATRLVLAVLLLVGCARLVAQDGARVAPSDLEAARLAVDVFSNNMATRRAALKAAAQRGQDDVAAALIIGLRFLDHSRLALHRTLRAVTGANPGSTWADWLRWQQQHPEVQPFAGFAAFQSVLYSNIDPGFSRFLYAGVAHEIRLEEIVWGGVLSDGIPALTNPSMITAGQAGYLDKRDLVFGIEINGDARAYPYRIMDWHEMLNDVIGGVPVALAYCTLCGSGIAYDTRPAGRVPPEEHARTEEHTRTKMRAPFVFGSSGLLYRSNKLMYDTATHSLWNQFTGRPVVGTLTGSGIELRILPVVTTRWEDWRRAHPDTLVLSLDTGFERPYRPGAAYGEYFASADLMFPVAVASSRYAPKRVVFGLRISGSNRAWPLDMFAGGRVLNERVGVIDAVIVGHAGRREVRAYRAGGMRFDRAGADLQVLRSADGRRWRVTEAELVADDDSRLARLPGHLAYWFAWSGYLGED